MERLIDRYEEKLVEQGLVEPGKPLMAEMETEVAFNREDPNQVIFEQVFESMNISSLLLSQPTEPYSTIIDYLAGENDLITLKDNETRTFLHDIPVIRKLSAEGIIKKLSHRKAAIIEGMGIVTYGTVSPEQTFVNFSSVLFACFVKFFADHLLHAMKNTVSPAEQKAFEKAVEHLPPLVDRKVSLKKGPFSSEEEVYEAIYEAGKRVVDLGFVDSVMGNISYCYNDNIYISQTGTFLDELEGFIEICPLDQSSCTGITASSELPAHMMIIKEVKRQSILHGHPKFAVIMSMVCDKESCEYDGLCHIKCPDSRYVGVTPIVPGESGTGTNALCNTVPKALKESDGAIVYGHGVFAAGNVDFNAPFATMMEIEKTSRNLYFHKLQQAIKT